MHELCHRCHRELPSRGVGDPHSDENVLLFCARCGAPQILLPEHMRVEEDGAQTDVLSTTGTTPPPRPAGSDDSASGRIDWRAALPVAALIALAGMVLALAGMKWAGVQAMSVLWTMSGAVTALGLYARRRPLARVDGRVGLRIGVATGLLMVVAVAVGMAATGVVARYGLHAMGNFDSQRLQESQAAQQHWIAWMHQQNQDKELEDRYVAIMNSPLVTSPEVRAGSALASMGFYACLILLLSAGGGAFAGMIRGAGAARHRLRPRD
jgi:hypothetical protein